LKPFFIFTLNYLLIAFPRPAWLRLLPEGIFFGPNVAYG